MMDLPVEIPFVEQHRPGAPVTDEFGDVSIPCACGKVCRGLGTLGGARVVHRTHADKEARLTPAQEIALAAAARIPGGMLPIHTATRTEAVLTARGLAEPTDDPAYPDRVRITGAGLGVLTEHRRRKT